MNFESAKAIMVHTLLKHASAASNPKFGEVHEWTLVYSYSIKPLGLCNITRKTITLNAKYAESAPRDKVADTILHECAHALCGIEISPRGRRMAHGRKWKMWARRVGASPSATKCASTLGDYGEEIAANRVKKVPKWVVVVDHGDRLEKVSEAGRKMVRLETKFLKKDPSTKGKLWMVERKHWDMYKGDRDKIAGYRLLVR